MTLPSRLVISGVPGSGKSFFVDWLAETQGFLVLKADDNSIAFNAVWHAAQTGHAALVKASIVYAMHRHLAIELGFVPAEPALTGVRTLIAAGFDGWWFPADYPAP